MGFFFFFHLPWIVSGCQARAALTAQGPSHNPSLRWENMLTWNSSSLSVHLLLPRRCQLPQGDWHNQVSMIHSTTAWHPSEFVYKTCFRKGHQIELILFFKNIVSCALTLAPQKHLLYIWVIDMGNMEYVRIYHYINKLDNEHP